MQRGRRRRVRSSYQESSSGKLMALSLFIMLLAFFIVLNTLSSYEDAKVTPIFESLEAAFASKITEDNDLRPSVTKDREHSINEGSTLDRIQALFRSRIPSKNIDRSKHKGTMQVVMSLELFEQSVMNLSEGRQFGDHDDSGGGALFLPSLVALLRSNQLGTPYHMDIALNISGKPAFLQNNEPQKLSLVMKRASTFTNRIEQAGLPPKLMTIGLQEGKEDTVEILFRPYIPFSPLEETGGDNE